MSNKYNTLAWIKCFITITTLLALNTSYASVGTRDLGSMSMLIMESFSSLAKLITAGAYIAGLGFSVGAIMKFKQHKDNPTQITIGTPIALVFIAAALLFLPSILSVTGATMFGAGGAKPAGVTGTIFRGSE